MPQLGETVAEGKVASWFKSVGDKVAAGDALLEIETDKVTMEIQAIESGVLSEIRVAAGTTVPVGTVLAVLGESGAARQVKANGGTPLAAFEEVRTSARSYGTADGPLGLKVTPLARRLASEGKLDLAAIAEAVHARGGRRIVAADVIGAPAPAPAARPQRAGDQVLPLNRIRAQTAARLSEAWRTIPHVFQAVEIDFSAVARAREETKARFAERHGVALTYLPFVARAVCLAIADFPRVNAVFEKQLALRRDIHLGIAVDLAHEGLVVPVVAHADEMTAGGLAKAIARQVEKARTGKLGPADIEGGTYTISNNGRFGTLFTTPIINAPQVAILSMDAVAKRPVVVGTAHGDAIAARPVAVVGQSFDHRAFDGAYSASFLARLKEIIETRDWASELS
ncbi:MAG TPA: dihydrolipoamide acetyltransferase family protein [Stellaceae bacterium]|nr:dihydrolipoamide acetyltransferase family protein [Stellaceae bacterium]